ncbi:tRNA (5-methylaminomethyl-2-thiouridine)(34)-methyltransferase MnmD [Maricaulis parjimensis]|uniref:tRNA (5-methylaminomethyl-2-thiouridine)(34)-methyltransferase MnmD n=1 Tax=Maricaulis parjimensis TaxID=144023 RepID=UPI001939D0A5|nr:tRNA (5-methylaminomethyl-2-thiouridine)(34)-methyltransferase MnmD [Maricaulis parjimensis]
MTDSLVCEPAKLDWSQASGPRAADYDDVYFSAEDGLEETRSVFLKACHMPEIWQGRRHVTVGELGFGTGLNALALWQLWRETRSPGAWLDFVSIEKHPLSREEAARAFAQWPSLANLSDRLLAQWPPRLKGAHRLVFPEDGFAITLFHDEAEAALAQIDARMDAWFLDGFAPARNAAMWSQPVLDAVGRLSAPGARVGTFTVAGFVRRGLAEAGFSVSKQPGFGRKRERLEAIFPGEVGAEMPAPGRVAIIGAGIAGASLAHALNIRGCETVLVDRDGLAGGASGAPAGLLTPRLERADRPHVRATLAAFDFARRLYSGLDDFWEEGVLRLPKDDAEARRFADIADMMDDSVVWQAGGLHLTNSGRFLPASLVRQLAGETERLQAGIAEVEAGEAGCRLLDGQGETVLEADIVIHASGAGAAARLPDISPSAGQLAVFAGTAPSRPVTWGHYLCAAPQGVLVGATHVRGEAAGPAEPAIAGFRDAAAAHCPDVELGDVMARWAGVRASTPDRLPVAGALGPREFILSGLGSRGFAHAPLLAEQLAAQICGHATALEKDGASVLLPGRFEMRRRRREG